MKLRYGYASFAQWAEEHLTLHLSTDLFDAGLWQAITVWLQTKVGSGHWLSEPFQVMTAEEDMAGYPRW
jgi:hypothetical protein